MPYQICLFEGRCFCEQRSSRMLHLCSWISGQYDPCCLPQAMLRFTCALIEINASASPHEYIRSASE